MWQRSERLEKCLSAGPIVSGLRPRRERPRGRRAAEQRDELPPSHARHGLPPSHALPPPIIPAGDRHWRSRFAALPACRWKAQPVLGADLNRSEARWLLFGSRAAAHPTPARPLGSPSSLDNIVLASGAVFPALAGCPGYVDPLAAALKRTVPSDSAPAIVVATRWPRRVRLRSGANSLLAQ
jgi:hypothetical protein